MTTIPPETSTPASRSWKDWLDTIGPVLGLLLVFGLFKIFTPRSFGSITNLETISRQTAIVGIAALGMTMIIILGGIDLSVGSVVALGTVVIAACLKAGASPLTAAIAGVIAGGLCGLTNGLLITRLKVVPFIVTLGTLLLVRGVAKGIAHEQKIDAPLTWLIDLLATVRKGSWMIVPPGVWIMIVLAFTIWAVLRYTRLGRHTFAIGSNEQTARLCGVSVDQVKIVVYALAGALVGLAGLMQFSRLTVGDPTVAAGLELDVIAAVVIGGGSLSGGRGSILGTIVGALIMAVIRSGCTQFEFPDAISSIQFHAPWLLDFVQTKGLPNWVQEIVTGIIIVLAVTIDRYRQSKSE
jgi:ribose transport system permease protein